MTVRTRQPPCAEVIFAVALSTTITTSGQSVMPKARFGAVSAVEEGAVTGKWVYRPSTKFQRNMARVYAGKLHCAATAD